MKKPKLTGRRAVWAGIVGTPFLLIAALVTLGVAAATPAGQSSAKTAAPAANGKLVSHNAATGSAGSVAAYWTTAKMAAAKPVKPLAAARSTAPTASVAATGVPSTSPGFVAPGMSQGPSGGPSPAQGVSSQSECYHCPIPFTRYYYYARYRSYPVSTVGKLFFSNDGGNYVCSGSVIGDHTVWTAGHCLANTDGTHLFSTNLLFCPSYNAGVNPAVGCWSGIQSWTWSPWKDANSFEWDMGGLVMSNCGTVHCQSIGSYTSWLGFAWNWPRNLNYVALGYPQGAPFNGAYLVECNSSFGYEDSDGNNQGGPNSSAIGCDMTGGSSGGPWVWQFGSNNYVNGHQDWYHTAYPNEINTPYFDGRACTIATTAQAFSATC